MDASPIVRGANAAMNYLGFLAHPDAEFSREKFPIELGDRDDLCARLMHERANVGREYLAGPVA